uniref:NmrA-like domain-containing protein n=1 Tax=Aegilops tauschii subsp. strangulata TaxID=200361 RepID=A0A453DMN5_AEGTS
MRIVMAIKEAGNLIKVSQVINFVLFLDGTMWLQIDHRIVDVQSSCLPSEFGSDVERVHTVDPAATLYTGKIRLHCLIEAEGIHHTFVCCNGFAET